MRIYFRRYCLFTMVGFAGEDDLDAPDLPTTNAIEVVANGSDAETLLGGATDVDPARGSLTPIAEESADTGADDFGFPGLMEHPRRKRGAARKYYYFAFPIRAIKGSRQ